MDEPSDGTQNVSGHFPRLDIYRVLAPRGGVTNSLQAVCGIFVKGINYLVACGIFINLNNSFLIVVCGIFL